jgi:hypothetical protein
VGINSKEAWREGPTPTSRRPLHGVFCLLALAATLAAGCQYGYPIAPTPCDEWCEANRQVGCDARSPAVCVELCEESGMASKRECVATFETALSCLKAAVSAGKRCSFDGAFDSPCSFETSAALSCRIER